MTSKVVGQSSTAAALVPVLSLDDEHRRPATAYRRKFWNKDIIWGHNVTNYSKIRNLTRAVIEGHPRWHGGVVIRDGTHCVSVTSSEIQHYVLSMSLWRAHKCAEKAKQCTLPSCRKPKSSRPSAPCFSCVQLFSEVLGETDVYSPANCLAILIDVLLQFQKLQKGCS